LRSRPGVDERYVSSCAHTACEDSGISRQLAGLTLVRKSGFTLCGDQG